MKKTLTQPQGKSLRELRRLVEASNDRYQRIGAVWNELTDDEQMSLVLQAEGLASETAR